MEELQLLFSIPGFGAIAILIWILKLLKKEGLIYFGKKDENGTKSALLKVEQLSKLSEDFARLKEQTEETNRIIKDAIGVNGWLAKEDSEDGRKWVYVTPKMRRVQFDQADLLKDIVEYLEMLDNKTNKLFTKLEGLKK